MFLGGHDGKTAELRAPSVKGALRYWWRVLNSYQDVNKMHQIEADIFGSSHQDYQQKSKISIRVEGVHLTPTRKNLPQHNISVKIKNKSLNLNILDYLSFGTYEFKKGFIRDYYSPGDKFKIYVNYPDDLDEEILQEVDTAMYLCSFIGGLGSRTRNGFGKFLIEEMFEEDDYYTSDHISGLVYKSDGNPVEYTAFSKETKIFKTQKGYNAWHEALAEIGKAYHSARNNIEPKHVFKKRELISAPIMEGKKQVSKLERHAKPYFLSVMKNRSGKYDGYIFALPYKYYYESKQDYYENVIKEFNKKLNDYKNLQVVL
jgi:CRISPR-associated protein Cmr1